MGPQVKLPSGSRRDFTTKEQSVIAASLPGTRALLRSAWERWRPNSGKFPASVGRAVEEN